MNPIGLILGGLSNVFGTYMGYRKGKSLAKLEIKAERKLEAKEGIRDSWKYEVFVIIFFTPLAGVIVMPYIDVIADAIMAMSYTPGCLGEATLQVMEGFDSVPNWYGTTIIVMVASDIIVKVFKVYKNNP